MYVCDIDADRFEVDFYIFYSINSTYIYMILKN